MVTTLSRLKLKMRLGCFGITKRSGRFIKSFVELIIWNRYIKWLFWTIKLKAINTLRCCQLRIINFLLNATQLNKEIVKCNWVTFNLFNIVNRNPKIVWSALVENLFIKLWCLISVSKHQIKKVHYPLINLL